MVNWNVMWMSQRTMQWIRRISIICDKVATMNRTNFIFLSSIKAFDEGGKEFPHLKSLTVRVYTGDQTSDSLGLECERVWCVWIYITFHQSQRTHNTVNVARHKGKGAYEAYGLSWFKNALCQMYLYRTEKTSSIDRKAVSFWQTKPLFLSLPGLKTYLAVLFLW